MTGISKYGKCFKETGVWWKPGNKPIETHPQVAG